MLHCNSIKFHSQDSLIAHALFDAFMQTGRLEPQEVLPPHTHRFVPERDPSTLTGFDVS